jgi:DNA-binding response OmpR family regulator
VQILVAEDDPRLADLLGQSLTEAGWDVEVVADGRSAYGRALPGGLPYDVLLLDWMLPEMDGVTVCRRLRDLGVTTPVLMLTARGEVRDRVAGLDAGADDYLAKPFDFPELVARVRALGRRATPAVPPVLRSADIVLDPAKRTVTRRGSVLELTRKEFGVLEVLMAAGGAVVSSEELLERVWDENADPFTTTVRVTVMTLRKKLGEPGIIDTVVGSGYRVPAESPAVV